MAAACDRVRVRTSPETNPLERAVEEKRVTGTQWKMLRLIPAICGVLMLANAAPAQTTQTPPPTTPPTTATPTPTPAEAAAAGHDRLFLAFAEDATFTDKQWWEGQIEYADGDPVDFTIFRLQVALQPIKAPLELGGRVGFGNTDGPGDFPDGSGATDLDVWGKWNFGTMEERSTTFAAGALATVPTGDDTAGLGTDAFNIELFGAVRYRAKTWSIAGHAGVRINDDGQIGGFQLEGKNSTILGGAVLFQLANNITAIGEINFESERFREADDDGRILGGIDWAVVPRGVVRGAVSAGLTDGAPNLQLIVGYAGLF
jgi:hypothetical protein